jgi:hypothetical protein
MSKKFRKANKNPLVDNFNCCPQIAQVFTDIDSICGDLRNLRAKLPRSFVRGAAARVAYLLLQLL